MLTRFLDLVEDILNALVVATSTEEERDTFVALAICRIDFAEDLHSQRKILNDVSMRLKEATEKGCIVTMLFFAATVIEIHGRFWWYPTAARYKLG